MEHTPNQVVNKIMIDKIRKRMKEMNINARKLAKLAEVGQSFVYDILNGKSKNPTSNKLNLIAKELGLSVSYLINTTNDQINYDHYVPIYNLDEKQDANFLLSKTFCLNKIEAEKNKLYTHNMYDDSMSPTIQKNETMIIKYCDNLKSITSGIFLLKDKFNSIIRRIENVLGTTNVKIIPDNSKYSTYIKNFKDISIVGEVIFIFKEM
jgi:transcriptional regulator with XRE-family HTH domain